MNKEIRKQTSTVNKSKKSLISTKFTKMMKI